MTEARVPVTDDALVEKVAAALEAAWNQSRDLPPIDFVQREREELANAVIAIAYPTGVAAGREEAWRDGFNCARQCLTDDEAFCLTEDVEQDAWVDSKTAAAIRQMGGE